MVPKTLCRVHLWVGVALSSLSFACQGSNLTLPGDGLPASLREVSGSGQRGTIGSQLPKPLVVQVTDAANRPVEQASLRFMTQVPGAEILPADVATDSSGKAEVLVRLGTIEGVQTFDAELANAADLRTTFSVIAVANQPPDDGGGGGPAGGDGHGHDEGHDGGHRGNEDSGGGHGHGEHGHNDHDDHGHGHGSDKGDRD